MKLNEDGKCAKCNGTTWYRYDENHMTRCKACCTHDKGWWVLGKDYYKYKEGGDNRCCKNGCGAMKRDL